MTNASSSDVYGTYVLFWIRFMVPPATSIRDETAGDGPDEHPGKDDAADEALLRAGHTPLSLHCRPQEGDQHNLERLPHPAQAGVGKHQGLEPAEADAGEHVVRCVASRRVASDRHSGGGASERREQLREGAATAATTSGR